MAVLPNICRLFMMVNDQAHSSVNGLLINLWSGTPINNDSRTNSWVLPGAALGLGIIFSLEFIMELNTQKIKMKKNKIRDSDSYLLKWNESLDLRRDE